MNINPSTWATKPSMAVDVSLMLEAQTAESFRMTRDALIWSSELPHLLRGMLWNVVAPLVAEGMHATYPKKCECTLNLDKRMTQTYTVLVGDAPAEPEWQLTMHLELDHSMSFAQTKATLQVRDFQSQGQYYCEDYLLKEGTVTLSEKAASALDLVLSRYEGELPPALARYHIAADILHECTP